MTDLNFKKLESGLSSKQKLQLAEEEMWINRNDEWLDYDSNEDNSEEESEEEDGSIPTISTNKESKNDGNGNSLEGEEEEDEDIAKKKKELGEDELYNDKADEDDQKWVDKHLAKYLGSRETDAVLNCPCCFTLLCVDCQRHDIYVNQYRAMFVRNCKVSNKELRYKKTEYIDTSNNSKSKKSKKKEKEDISLQQPPQEVKRFEYVDNIIVEDEYQFEEEIYFPVNCAICDTEVAVIDKDEVYHFHNVIPSE